METPALLLLAVLLVAGLGLTTISLAAPEPVPLANASFDAPWDGKGAPPGWSLYAGGGNTAVKPVDVPGGKALLLEDNDAGVEIGVTTSFPAQPGLGYKVTVGVKAVPQADLTGAYLQFRFLPSGEFQQVPLYTDSLEEFDDIEVIGMAPAGTTTGVIYLYSHRDPMPRLLVDNVRILAGVPAPQIIPPPPPPVPPQYDKLKDMHQTFDLVAGGKPVCAIVAPASGVYKQTVENLQGTIRKLTGATVPVIADNAPGAAVPFTQNLIILGNRSTNKTSNALYDLHYSLFDVKYPGRGGYAVRTLHDPFANGFSAVLVGGSDAAGVSAAAQAFAQSLSRQAAGGKLTVGWTLLTKLGDGLKPDLDAKTAEFWDASKGYGSTGYFGWNSISKRMAMYYMLGDEKSAREVVRLAFPDAQALKEIDEIDGERIENKKDPLAGTYHYNSHMMILFWDLIEESPVFSDEERLKITNAFARQLNHRKEEGIYQLTAQPSAVGSRHGQWSAISHYCLGRYLNKYYPNPIWAQCVRGGELHFQSLHKSAWVNGESDNLFWYTTGTAPILVYMTMTGDRKPLQNGVLAELLRAQEALITGRVPDWALGSGALTYFNQAAYLTGDGRWLTYRDRCQMDTDMFRLGWSFWPDASLKPALPEDLCGKWTINALPKPMWQARGSGIPFAQSFQFGSFRSAPDARGDFILLDGFNGASRNPYHTFDVLELRLAGRTLLAGYHNQVLTSADGMLEPTAPMDGALLHRDVLGGTAAAVGEVSKLAYTSWRRSLAQRVGKYAVFCDDLTFRADSRNMQVTTTWNPVSGAWDSVAQAVKITTSGGPMNLPGWTVFRARQMPCTSQPAGPNYLLPLDSIDIMLLRATEPGQWLEMAFKLDRDFTGEAFADFLNYTDRGVVQLSLDGKPVGAQYDNRADGVAEATHPLGTVTLAAGEHKLRVEVVKRPADGDKAYVGFRGLNLKTAGAPAANTATGYELRSSDMQQGTGGNIITLQWTGAVKPGDHRKVFYLLAERPAGDQPLACVQVSPQAAALALPAPALAVSGTEDQTSGDLVILAADHLYGHNLTRAGVGAPLVIADKPVDLDWDYAAGKVAVVAAEATQLQLRIVPVKGLQLDGMAAPLMAGEAGLQSLRLTPGRHEIEAAMPPAEALKPLMEGLAAKLAAGQMQRQQLVTAAAAQPPLAAPALAAPVAASLGGRIADLITIPNAPGELLAAAEGKTLHLLDAAGQEVRRMECDGSIRSLNWWAEHQLLLAGCQDEKLIAFTLDGQRKWAFTSVMDPAVYEAAKPYWFKSAPGHEGIHGLITGKFYDGKSQAFVGGACTLEVVDENGQLVKRMPVFWGPLWKFRFLDAADGSRELLMAQWPNGSDVPWVLNNQKGLVGTRYYGAPSGHSYVGGWTAQQRTVLTAADLQGDGKTEVITAINGTWNRVTVYTAEGTPVANAQFGAGASNAPNAQMRDLGVADLNGDGKQELLVAWHENLIVALDAQCQRLWSTRLPSAPARLQAVTAAGGKPVLVVGCQDGKVYTLDGQGSIVGQGQIKGAPVERLLLQTPAGPRAVFGTDKGEVVLVAP